MKLRLRHNSVRLRLTQGEVAQLRQGGLVEEHVDFGANQRLVYRVRSVSDIEDIGVEYVEGLILLSVPEPMVAAWADSAAIGMESTGQMRVLIEKDFKCLDTSHPEDNVDTFPHPMDGKVC